MKKILMILFVALILSACGNEVVKEEESVEVIEVEGEVGFENFRVNDMTVTLFEEDGLDLADVSILWWNDSFPEPRTFMASSGFSVSQGETELKEFGVAMLANPNSRAYLKNAPRGGGVEIKYTYILENTEEDLELLFFSRNWDEENQSFVVEIK